MFENCSLKEQNRRDKRYYRAARPALGMRCDKLCATECHEPVHERPMYTEAAKQLIRCVPAAPMLTDKYLSYLFPRDKFHYNFSSHQETDPYEGNDRWNDYEYTTHHISGYDISVTFSYMECLNRLEMIIRIGALSDVFGCITYYDLFRGGEEKIKSYLCDCLAVFQYVDKEILCPDKE